MDLTCDERPSDSPYVESIWRNQGAAPGAFISMAQPLAGLCLTRFEGKATLTVRGPEIRATPAYCPPEAEFIGIQFKPGALMPNFPPSMTMDRQDINLPEANSRTFWLNGSAWQYFDFNNAETFIDRLVRAGLLIYDPVVNAALQGQPVSMSLRTVQRRFLQATGLTYGTIAQIKRARYATSLLTQGVPILDTVYQAGYADQPHLTRSLKQYIGLTPAQLTNQKRNQRLSFLFKTETFG